MSNKIEQLVNNNRQWAEQFEQKNPGIFNKLAKRQKPDYMWIGCSDSRVPGNTIIGLQPGEVFVHRNVGNLVNMSDMSALSALEFAVSVLEIKDIILCGHHDCGAVRAAMELNEGGIVNNWIDSIKNLYKTHQQDLDSISDYHQRANYLSELNVKQQVDNICQTSAVQDAWSRGQQLAIHGFIFSIKDGLIRNLEISRCSSDS
ncbi:MAG: carbonic anhydrase [Gammaproteobacteria bacterium]|nr:carbonic anhydrase [Gammaproteobacteria bacterium]